VKVSVFGISDVGVVRKNNEDCFLIAEMTSGASGLQPTVLAHEVQERGTLLVVSDGMGGAEAGEVASRLVVEQLRADLAVAPLDHSAVEVVKIAVEHANAVVWNDAQAHANHKGMGATLAAAWIRGSEVFIAGVGDSRVYLLRSGKMRQVTRDQSMVESLVEVGMIDRNEADHHPQRNVILQAMGARPEVVVAIERVELRRGDFLLLCSDGLSGKISAEEMRDCILTTAALPEACHRMVQLAKARGGEDNITVVVAELDGEGLPETTLNERMTRTLQSLSGFNFKTGAGYAPPPPAKPTHTFGSEDEPDPEPPPPPPPSNHDPTRALGSGSYPAAPEPKEED
jgi:serine/threonine protein phosphatase PrpC